MAHTRKGMLLVISGPSGTGKGTLCARLLTSDENIRFSISATTRAARAGEQEGREYTFISQEEFQCRVDAGDFLECAVVHGNRYGTPRREVLALVDAGIDVLLRHTPRHAHVLRQIILQGLARVPIRYRPLLLTLHGVRVA